MLRWLLAAQILTAFMTGTALLPGLRNNFGPFEIIGLLLFATFFVTHYQQNTRLRLHSSLKIILILAFAATLSLTQLTSDRIQLGFVQTLILFFMFTFVAVLYNLMLIYQVSPVHLLRLVTYSALIIGPWVLSSGFSSGDPQAAGPFRNRAHMASYMLTAFWLVLLYNFWPGISRREKLVSYLALASALYPVAVSGRRSVYLSLILGLAGVLVAVVVASRGRRRTAFAAAAVVLTVLGLFYTVGGRWVPQLEFFQERVGGIGARLQMATASEDADIASDDNFFVLQRRGVVQAFLDRPILGIGWGGFYRSQYSPTGHEVHSTPMRFMAELGLVGLLLYLLLMGNILFGSLKIIALLRRTPYRMPAIVLGVALWSLSVSYLYNRHITERTFWLLLAVYLSFEAFAVAFSRRQSLARANGRAPTAPRTGAAADRATRRRRVAPVPLAAPRQTRRRLRHPRPALRRGPGRPPAR